MSPNQITHFSYQLLYESTGIKVIQIQKRAMLETTLPLLLIY